MRINMLIRATPSEKHTHVGTVDVCIHDSTHRRLFNFEFFFLETDEEETDPRASLLLESDDQEYLFAEMNCDASLSEKTPLNEEQQAVFKLLRAAIVHTICEAKSADLSTKIVDVGDHIMVDQRSITCISMVFVENEKNKTLWRRILC